jgi:uncharacterized protein
VIALKRSRRLPFDDAHAGSLGFLMLRDQIKTDLTSSMKARDSIRTSTLRMLQTAVKNAEVEKRGELTDDEVKGAGRDELVDKEGAELAVLETYLPEGLSEAEIEALVDEAIQEAGASEPKHMGAVMKALMPKLQGRADGAIVSALVKSKLGA